ncbi:unnamed protein product, partial [Vitis vinifera]
MIRIENPHLALGRRGPQRHHVFKALQETIVTTSTHPAMVQFSSVTTSSHQLSPMPISTLASALANATPDQQRTMLSESLYPLVDQLEHEMAAKLTGMLLEMGQTEFLHLLESPEALKSKVAEAMDVLRNVAQQQANSPTEQLSSLSLNDSLVP